MHWSFNKRDALLFTLAGLLTSLVLAIGLIWQAPNVTRKKMSVNDHIVFILGYEQVGIAYRVWHSADATWPWPDQFPDNAEGVSGSWVGLPFTAIHRRVEFPIQESSNGAAGITLHPAYLSPKEFHYDLDLYRLYWPGLVADTFFWGAILWIVRCIWQTSISRRRSRKGLCIHCAYDRDGFKESDPCPECGEALSNSSC